MKFYNKKADIHVPDGVEDEQALARTTIMSIAAHQDDCEIMAYHAIATCYEADTEWYAGVVLTDGGGSPRSGEYAHCSNHEIHVKRSQEQRAAADIGKYGAMVQLAYSSADVRTEKRDIIEAELTELLEKARPHTMFIHNTADRHETHLGACLRALGALRKLPKDQRPRRVYGMEVWRSLDWLSVKDRLIFDTSPYPALAKAVIQAFDSQCTPKKRFDLAALGRRMGNATFQEPRQIDPSDSCSLGMDLTPLIEDDTLSIRDFTLQYADSFRNDVKNLLDQLL